MCIATNYSKHSMPVLRVDAQFTVIEAALKGYVKWRSNPSKSEENSVRTPTYSINYYSEPS